jgi:hypothetical protein
MSDEELSLTTPTTRREFAKAAAIAVAAPVLAPLAACAPAARIAPAPAAAPAAAPVTAPAAPVAPSAPSAQVGGQQRAPDPQSIHLAEALKAKYGDRLTDEQWEEVRKGIEGNLRTARALRSFEIPIQTEPAFTFRAYRGGDR